MFFDPVSFAAPVCDAATSDRLAMFIPSLAGGGAERTMLTLLGGMVASGVAVDLVLAKAEGAFLDEVPAEVRLFDLGAPRMRQALPRLAFYLRRERPRAIVSQMFHTNLTALISRMLAGVNTRVVVVEANTLSAEVDASPRARWLLRWVKKLYPRADAIVGVSAGVARDLERQLNMPSGKVETVFYPVPVEQLLRKAAEPPLHPWFHDQGPPILLATGRLAPQKDYPTLLRAFAMLRRRRPARLLILGEGPERKRLENLAAELGIAADLSLPGFAANPYAAMARARLLVLSSRFEGLPTVLMESLVCGCPVVATDCPSGPNEIIRSEDHGLLVPVGDPAALADALHRAIDKPWDRDCLRRRGEEFSVARATAAYLRLLGFAGPRTEGLAEAA